MRLPPPQSSNSELPAVREMHERESLMHVLIALSISGAIAFLALWTLWPQALRTDSEPQVVLAADDPGTAGEIGRSQLATLPRALPPLPQVHASSENQPTTAPRLLTLHGTVVDEFWRPVAAAEIWVLDGKWKVLTHTNSTGAFSKAVDPAEWTSKHPAGGAFQIGARAKSHGPSSIQSFANMPTGALRLMLTGQGAGLRLEVRDQAGGPLQDVLVRLGPAPASDLDSATDSDQEGELDPRPAQHVPAPLAKTNRWGLVRLDGLAAGRREMTLKREGYSIRRGRLVFRDGDDTRRVIKMSANASLRGQAVRLDRGPVAGARVVVSSEGTLQEFEAVCDEWGEFVLDGLPSGRVNLSSRLTTPNGQPFQCSAEFYLAPGESSIWNPVLVETLYLDGRLVGSLGQPLAGWRVELEQEGELDSASTETDEDGRYELPEPQRFSGARLLFYNPLAGLGIPTRVVPLARTDSRDSTTELREDEENVGRILGRVVRADGTGAEDELMVLYRILDRQSVVIELDAEGLFRTPQLPPGSYLPVFPRHGQGWAPNASWLVTGLEALRVDQLELPATGLLVLQTSDAGRYSETCDLSIELLLPEISADYSLPIFDGTIEVPAEFGYAPGHYRILIRVRRAMIPMEFQVASGNTTTLILPPGP